MTDVDMSWAAFDQARGTKPRAAAQPPPPPVQQQPAIALPPAAQKQVAIIQKEAGLPATGQLDAQTIAYAKAHYITPQEKANTTAKNTAAKKAAAAARKAASAAKKKASAKKAAEKKVLAAKKKAARLKLSAEKKVLAAKKKAAKAKATAAKKAARLKAAAEKKQATARARQARLQASEYARDAKASAKAAAAAAKAKNAKQTGQVAVTSSRTAHLSNTVELAEEARWAHGWVPLNAAALQEKHHDVDIQLYDNKFTNTTQVGLIRTKGDARGSGKASAALDDLVKLADQTGRTLTLTPDPIKDKGSLSKTALETWYKSRGFKRNRNRPEISDSYYREPTKSADLAITPGGRIGDASPLGKPGSKRKLSDYEREVAHSLMKRGIPKERAIPMARGIINNWKQGRTGKGKGKVSAAVQAGAAASIAQRKSFSNETGDADMGNPTVQLVDLAGIANFGGKKAAPFAKGGGKRKKKPQPHGAVDRVAAAKALAKNMRSKTTASMSNTRSRTTDLGKDGSEWKHGYIPENAAAVALKAHKKPGGGSSQQTPLSGDAAKARNRALSEKGIRDQIKTDHPVNATRDYQGRDVLVVGHSGRKVKISDRLNRTTKVVQPHTLSETSSKTKISTRADVEKAAMRPKADAAPSGNVGGMGDSVTPIGASQVRQLTGMSPVELRAQKAANKITAKRTHAKNVAQSASWDVAMKKSGLSSELTEARTKAALRGAYGNPQGGLVKASIMAGNGDTAGAVAELNEQADFLARAGDKVGAKYLRTAAARLKG